MRCAIVMVEDLIRVWIKKRILDRTQIKERIPPEA